MNSHKDEEQLKEKFSDLNVKESTIEYSPTPTNGIEFKSLSSQKQKPQQPISAQLPIIESSSNNYDPSVHISLPNQVIETNPPHTTYQMKDIINKDTSISTLNSQIENEDSTLSNPLQQSGIIKSKLKSFEKSTNQIYRSTKLYKEKLTKQKPSEHWNSYSVTFLKYHCSCYKL